MANRTDIPYGKENAVRIDVLATLWSISDRNARDMIATFRKTASDDNTVIVSSSKGPAGYWRTDKPEEIRAYINETEARAHNTTLALKRPTEYKPRVVAAANYQQRDYEEKELEDQLGVNEIFKPKKTEVDR